MVKSIIKHITYSYTYLSKINRCMIYNLTHWVYVLGGYETILVTKIANYNISPRAVRELVIGRDSIRFLASFNGALEYMDIPMVGVIQLTKNRGYK